ncbi:metal-binding protein [Chamaesiphon polymorphus CCALA 037]|uniref:Metal-binding protein n=1 Tax=Chamaesiphon polymorphus CCALA 037 TaxID=2107692 RepID=A0A2T1GCS5_9CYAN|nr:metal-binding protein [Chamaesiphon polymorphus CCALA 037]
MTLVDRNLTLSPQECASTPVTLADYIYPAIQKQYITIITLEADVLADEDLEAVHQMRVSLRRLRSQIQAFAPILDIPKVMGVKQIGQIGRTLGKVRDLDVLQELLKNYRSSLPESEQTHLEKVAATLVKRRRKEISKVKLMLDDREYQYFKLGMNNWLNSPQYMPNARIEFGSILPDLLLTVAGQLFLNPGWWIDLNSETEIGLESGVSQLLTIHGETMHGLRKQVKALRYLMEMFPDRYPDRYRDHLKDFKQIHQIFGNIQDNLVLDKFIRKALGKRSPIKLPTLYERIARSNYLNWQNWQPIQERYRQSETKHNFKLMLIQDIIK